MEAFVGLYWTCPVNWAGFRQLSADVDAAAAQSRTIRYQVERVRRWVTDEAGTLVDEITFMDSSPDRPTDAIYEAVSRVHPICVAHNAKLVIARFGRWRQHHFLHHRLSEMRIRFIELDPQPMTIDGLRFEPIEHFQHWANTGEAASAARRRDAIAALQKAGGEIEAGPGRYEKIAQLLNQTGVKTFTGKAWTGENVKKALRMPEVVGE